MIEWLGGWRERHGSGARLGITGLLAVRGAAGGAFGALARRGGGLVAVVAWDGRCLWLDDAPRTDEQLARLATVLAGPAVQIWLRRRRADLTTSLVGWETLVAGGEPASAWAPRAALVDEYATLTTPRLRADGLARVWAGLLVAGRDPAHLGQRVATLCSLLGERARPLTIAELSAWLADWLGGPAGASGLDARSPIAADELAPTSVTFAEDHIALSDEQVVRVWTAGQLPTLVEVGWVRHLLAEPAYAMFEYDLLLESQPVANPSLERRATAKLLRRLDHDLAGRARAGRPASGALLAQWQAERGVLASRLTALAGSGTELRRATMSLAIRGLAAERGALGGPLVGALARLGFAPHPVRGRHALERAWQAVGPPVAVDASPAGAVLAANDLAPLAWWAVAPDQPPAVWPVVTVSAERTAAFGPARLAEHDHLVATGAPGTGAASALVAWGMTLALGGASVIVIERGGAAAGLAAVVGGSMTWLGPAGQVGLDPVAAVGHRLDDIAEWTAWLDECDQSLGAIMPQLDDADRGTLRAVLVEMGLARLERAAPLDLLAFRDRLVAGGHARLAETLDVALDGSWGWLTSVGTLPDWPAGLHVIGWSGTDDRGWPVVAGLAVGRLWRARRGQAARGRPPAVVVVLDGAACLTNDLAAEALIAIGRGGRRVGLRLWVDAGAAGPLARLTAGRLLLANAAARASFRDPGATASDLVDGLGWPAAVAGLVPGLPDDMALVRTGRATQVCRVAIGPLVERVGQVGLSRSWPAVVMASD